MVVEKERLRKGVLLGLEPFRGGMRFVAVVQCDDERV